MPSISNLFQGGGSQWLPDADVVNAPEGALLRADNLVPDAVGALSLRNGSSVLYSSLGDEVHTLYAAELSDGTTYRIAGVDDIVYINGTSQLTGLAGSGDLAVADDSYQIFFARGSDKYKWDGTNREKWGINRPIAAPTLAAVASITSTVAHLDDGTDDEPDCTIPEGGGSIGNADSGDSTQLTPNSTTYRAIIQKLWTSDQDFLDISGVAGRETDLFDLSIKFDNPRNVERVKIVFGLDNSSTVPFDTNRFEFEFNIIDGIEVPLKDLNSEGYGAYTESILKSLTAVSPADVTNIQTPEQVKTGLSNVGQSAQPQNQPPPDGGVWGHLTVTRGQFKRIGNSEGRGWDTVRGFKIIYTTVQGKTNTVTVKDAIFVGGGERALTGTYRAVIRAARPFRDADDVVRYYELSPPSDQTDPINLNHQNLQVTIPQGTLTALDDGVTEIWIYLFGGWLDSYYRFAVVPAAVSQGMSIDELKSPVGSDFNTAVKRSRIPSWGFTYVQTGTGYFSVTSITRASTTATVTTDSNHGFTTGDSIWIFGADQDEYNGVQTITVTGADTFTYEVSGTPASPATTSGTIYAHDEDFPGDGVAADTSASTNVVVSLRTTELDALTENERLEPYQMQPPDDIIDIAGPWRGRFFCLTDAGYVYPSTQRDPGSFNSLQVIDLTRFGDPKWIARSTNGIYVGMEKDIVFLAGTGDDSIDLAQIDLYPQPLGVGNPPFDECHWREGNAIIYRSTDGLYQLAGNSVTPVPLAGTSLLWRGLGRHGVGALNVESGRFRCAVDNRMLYVLAPEGAAYTSTNTILRYSIEKQQWSRFVYPQAGNFLCIFNEPDGTLVAGDDEGRVWKLDDGEQDDGNDIYAFLLTAIEDGGQPLAQKDAFDLQIHCNTGFDSATVSLFKDGESAETSTYTANTGQPQVWRANASNFGTFIKAQMQIEGTFSVFRLHKYDLTYRIRPQHSMYLDTGYLQAPEPGDLVWMQEVEVDVNSPSDLTMSVYLEDTLWYSTTVGVTANKRSVVRMPLPRGTKGYRPRITFATTASDGAGQVGFDMYSVRVRLVGSGNQDAQRQYYKVWPAGQAP